MANDPDAILSHSFPPPLTTGSFTWATWGTYLAFLFFQLLGFFFQFYSRVKFQFQVLGKGEVVPQCFVHHHQYHMRAEEVKLV